MFPPRRPSQPQQPSEPEALNRPVILKPLEHIPTLDDINYLVGQGGDNRGRRVEFSWTVEEKQLSYRLTVTCEWQGGEPSWVLYSGTVYPDRGVWTHTTGDTAIIHNLVVHECDPGELREAHGQVFAYLPSQLKRLKGEMEGADHKPEEGEAQPAPQNPAQQTTQPAAAVPAETESPEEQASLQGNLEEMPAQSLLQSIAISKLSGRLSVIGTEGGGGIYFDQGIPVHATALKTMGDQAVVELCLWESGKFRFKRGEQTAERSVKRRLDNLLLEVATVADQWRRLTEMGVKMESYLAQKDPSLSMGEFARRILQGASANPDDQRRFYKEIDGKTTLFDLIRRMQMCRSQWVPISFNLLTLDLVTAQGKPPAPERRTSPEAIPIDRTAIEAVEKNLLRVDTGMLAYPVLLFFLEQEFFRFEAVGLPFSVVIFEIVMRGPLGPQHLPTSAVREVVERITEVKRNMDLLAHLETFEFALLLPVTEIVSAQLVAKRIYDVLRESPIQQDIPVENLMIAMGIAGVPEDCEDPGTLLACARTAKDKAKRSGTPIVMYKTP